MYVIELEDKTRVVLVATHVASIEGRGDYCVVVMVNGRRYQTEMSLDVVADGIREALRLART